MDSQEKLGQMLREANLQVMQLQQQVTQNLERYEPRVQIEDFDEHHDTSPISSNLMCPTKKHLGAA